MSRTMKEPIIDIAFRVWGNRINPEDISNALNIQPTEAFMKDDVRILANKKGKTRIKVKTGKWFLETKNYVSSQDVTDHLEFILALLEKLDRPLYAFEGVDTLGITLILASRVTTDAIDFNLSPVLLARIATQKLVLSFTVI